MARTVMGLKVDGDERSLIVRAATIRRKPMSRWVKDVALAEATFERQRLAALGDLSGERAWPPLQQPYRLHR